MYTEYFGFREFPFNITPDPRFLYLNDCYQEAVAALGYGIEGRKGFVSLIGEAGTGKTTLLRNVLDTLDPGVRTVLLLHPTVSFDEILEHVLQELGIPLAGAGKLMRLQRLNEFLLEHTRGRGNVALLVDEAQDLAPNVLEELRLLSNLETGREKILQIILAGQPELETHLSNPGLRQLRQRIALHIRLRPLAPAEVVDYVQNRIKRAGCPRTDLFAPDALAKIAAASRGIPRIVNVLCDAALLSAFGHGAQQVTSAMIDEVWIDHGGHPGLLEPITVVETGGPTIASTLPESPSPLTWHSPMRGPSPPTPAPVVTPRVVLPPAAPALPPPVPIASPETTKQAAPAISPPPVGDLSAGRWRKVRTGVGAVAVVVGVWAVARQLAVAPAPDGVWPDERPVVQTTVPLPPPTAPEPPPSTVPPTTLPPLGSAGDIATVSSPPPAAPALDTPPTAAEAMRVVEAFRVAYEARDVQRLTDLFTPDARIDRAHGREAGARYFRDTFAEWTGVELTMPTLRVLPHGSRTSVTAPVTTRYRRRNGTRGYHQGSGEFVLIRTDEGVRIAGFSYRQRPPSARARGETTLGPPMSGPADDFPDER